MANMSLVIALKKTIFEGVSLPQMTKEYKDLTPKDKQELVVEFNKTKPFGEDTVVVLSKQ